MRSGRRRRPRRRWLPRRLRPALAAPIDTHKFVLADAQDDVVGTVQITIASKEDTLPDIARRFDVGYEEIVRANPGVDPWIPGAGRHIVVPTQFILPNAPREGIVINVAAMRLYYFPPHRKDEPQLVYTHPIGIGKVGWSTPEGVTEVVSHVKDPVWRPSAALRIDHRNDNGEDLPPVVAAGPDNPLGKYEFRLGWPSYLIHGTNKPYGVGLRSSHGCVRLYPEDIEKIFQMVPNGTQVRVVNQPFLFGWHDAPVVSAGLHGARGRLSAIGHNAQKKLLAHALPAHVQAALRAQGAAIDWQSVSGGHQCAARHSGTGLRRGRHESSGAGGRAGSAEPNTRRVELGWQRRYRYRRQERAAAAVGTRIRRARRYRPAPHRADEAFGGAVERMAAAHAGGDRAQAGRSAART